MSTDAVRRGSPRPVGRGIRLVVGGVALGSLAIRGSSLRSETLLLGVGVAVGLLALYSGVHLVVRRRSDGIDPWLGAVLANLPVVLLFVLGGPVGRVGTIVYVGTALVIAGVLGDSGCEVMSIPGLLLGSRTHLACIAFSPIDWVEARLESRFRNL